MRKTLFIALSVFAALIIAFAAVLLVVDPNQFRGTIQAKLEKSLGRTVSLGNMSLKLVPLSLRIDDVSIGESARFASSKPFLTAKALYVRVGLLRLAERE